MMLYPAIGELEKVTHSRYALVTITAKRARQLLEASEQNGTPLSDKPVKLAINDIAQGKVRCKEKTEEESIMLQEEQTEE